MKKLVSVAAAVVVAPALFASAPVFADSPGQLSNAPTNYEVKNISTDNKYGQSANATCGNTLRYSVLIANSDFGQLDDVTVKTDLKTGTTRVSAQNANNQTTAVEGKVNVTTNGTLTYKSGSTVRVDTDSKRTTLGDGITGAGVNAGVLKGSTQTFVQFDAEVKCDTPPVTPPTTPGKIQVCELATKKLVTINENAFDSSKYTKDLSKCNAAPVELVKTGPASVAAIFAVAATIGAIAYNVVLRRQNAR